MKNLQILIMCCFLVLLTACGREDGGGTAQIPVASEEITESITQMPDEQEREAMPENMELGITVNDVYYPIPVSLKQLTEDGWNISGQTPYFLEPFVGEEYYETRADWSLTEDGQGILPGGSIIRLLEKRQGVVRGDHYKPGVHRVGYPTSKNRRWCGRFYGGFL